MTVNFEFVKHLGILEKYGLITLMLFSSILFSKQFGIRAIKRFNVALRMDPTYVRAVICRAEAYELMQEVSPSFLFGRFLGCPINNFFTDGNFRHAPCHRQKKFNISIKETRHCCNALF